MEPLNKRRRLAPKVDAVPPRPAGQFINSPDELPTPGPQQAQQQPQGQQQPQAQESQTQSVPLPHPLPQPQALLPQVPPQPQQLQQQQQLQHEPVKPDQSSSQSPRLHPQHGSPSLPPRSQPTTPTLCRAEVSVPAPTAPGLDRKDFYAFAHHLQDAAMLLKRQGERPPFRSVSVLLLRWEEDGSAESDLAGLEAVFRDQFRYRTERWNIPSVACPGTKLGIRIGMFLEQARPGRLLIMCYSGQGYLGADNQLYWACDGRDDGPRLKWDGVRCRIEDGPSDMLLLLDTCSDGAPAASGSHGMKQVIASCGAAGRGIALAAPAPLRPPPASSSSASPHPPPLRKAATARSFTAILAETLVKLGAAGPFTVERLHREISLQRRAGPAQAGAAAAAADPTIFFTLVPGKVRSLSLSVLPPADPSLDGFAGAAGATAGAPAGITACDAADSYDHSIDPKTVMDLKLDEDRVLVCTTFLGDASAELTNFNHWLRNTPPLAGRISVEGMFLGPNTTLLISMPSEVYEFLQGPEICLFLGQISSHNMIHLYHRLVESSSSAPTPPPLTTKIEDGRILLEAREAAATIPARPQQPPDPSADFVPTATTAPPEGTHHVAVEESAEMKEAAEQLKALKHVRHRSDEAAQPPPPQPQPPPPPPQKHQPQQRTILPDESPTRQQQSNGAGSFAQQHDSSVVAGETGAGVAIDPTPLVQTTTTSAISTAAPPCAKGTAGPAGRKLGVRKSDPQCAHCDHVPFKDSSSLRKHVAAAHTRPFPCAFAFAGCASTFGSKNEWKRHMASQHLCLTYYRCSQCPKKVPEGRDEFNRKDLFTQHLRRIHAPFHIKRIVTGKGDSTRQHLDWESHVRDMQQSCLVVRRQPPQRSACPRVGCRIGFEGPSSWDEWTEHVGRHLEKGEGEHLGVDDLLAEWALAEGIIERRGERDGYRLCEGTASANGGQTSPTAAAAAGGASGRAPGGGIAAVRGEGGGEAATENDNDMKPGGGGEGEVPEEAWTSGPHVPEESSHRSLGAGESGEATEAELKALSRLREAPATEDRMEVD